MAEAEHNESVDKGIHWTLRDVLRGKSSIIFVTGLALLFLAGIALELYFSAITMGAVRPSEMLEGVFALKANLVAQMITLSLITSIPILLILWIPIAFVLWIALNIRDHNVPRTEENLQHHAIESSRSWTWPWSIMVGCLDFIAAFFVFTICRKLFDMAFDCDPQASMTLIAITIFLIFAEYRVYNVSTRSTARLKGSKGTIDAVLDGSFDSFLPEKYRDEMGRAKVATVIHLGVVRTPRLAALIVRGIDYRADLKKFSSFLDSAFQGIISAVTFGIAARTCNEISTLHGMFAVGEGAEYVEGLRNPEIKKPHFVIEWIALIFCTVYVTADTLTLITMGTELLGF